VLDEFTVGETPTSSSVYQHELLEVDVDRNRISQALLNLLSNARKYSPKGSPITVTLQRSETEAIPSVHDHGVGIATEQLPSIYEPFYRVPNIRVSGRRTYWIRPGTLYYSCHCRTAWRAYGHSKPSWRGKYVFHPSTCTHR